ncbi:ABC transporter permease [Terrabacter sp. BE26]|uniref:ABC transporter permease n=1 Tax=Terrabacter sp. BE26 TaxID=2898152 RepID=UPI0035BE1748
MTTIQQRPAGRSGVAAGPTGASGTEMPTGRMWAVVAAREVVVRLTNRAFLVSTLITLLFIAGYGAFSVWQSGRTTTYTVAVTGADGTGLVERAATTAHRADDKVTVRATPAANEPAARALVDDGTADAWLHEGTAGWTLTSADDIDPALRTAVEEALRSTALERNATAAGTTVTALEKGTTLTTTRFDGETRDSGFVRGATFAFAILFFMAAMMFGQQIAASVVEEKQSRIVEIIATAIPLRQLLAGKVVGNSAIALAQVVVFSGVGLLAVSFTDSSTLLPSLSGAVVWFVLFFAVGFFALACLFAVAGALASRTEDLQSTTAPMTIVMMVVYIASFSLSGTALKIASFVPIASVVSMPGRILAGDAPWWEPALALVLMAGFSALTVAVGERIYRRSLLQTGGRVSWRQALHTGD